MDVRRRLMAGAGICVLLLLYTSIWITEGKSATHLLYRPVSSSIAVSAYFDLDPICGAWEDWYGYTNTDFGVFPNCSTGNVGFVYGHTYDQHEGTDYDGEAGESVSNAQIGTVTDRVIDCFNTYPAGPLSYGTYIGINHGQLSDRNRYRTLYGHLKCDGFLIANGTELKSVPVRIAEMGNTGYSSGDHLHLGVQRNDVPIDPYANGIISDTPPPALTSHNKPLKLWLPYWYYLISTGDSQVSRILLDGNLLFESPGCAKALWILGGSHTLTIWYEASDGGIPTVDINAWPFASPACAVEPGGSPPAGPTPPMPFADNAAFVSDVALPDGSIVSSNLSLTKTWRMRNTGTATWGSGYQLAFVGGERMRAPDAVDVPGTAPGQEADISVNLVSPNQSGEHTGYWQLRNPQGTYFGPRIWVKINVHPASARITTLSADPPSPADARQVIIHAKCDWSPTFRAMRIKIDGEVKYELGDPEYDYPWYTAGYSAGDHTIVVEVSDQTDTSWSRPDRRSMIYTLLGNEHTSNHAPGRPKPESPYNWYVTIGSPPELCAAPASDPDGDSIQYRFDTQASVGHADSGWISNRCWRPRSDLAAGTYEWKVKVKDSYGAESDWSDAWHYSIETSGVTINDVHFDPS